MPRTRRGRAGARARAALTVGAVTAAAGVLLAVPCAYPMSAVPADASGALASAAAPVAAANEAGFAPGAASDAGPVALVLPGLGPGVRARVVPVAVDAGGDLAVPDDPALLGWWSSAAGGSNPLGPVVIDGHVDSDRYGIGFFVNLRRLHPGDPVLLEDRTGRITRWTVTGSRQYPAGEGLPYEQVFSAGSGARLVLITCGGKFDHAAHAYADNLVVYAAPNPDPATSGS